MTLKELEDALIVMSAIQEKQASVQKLQALELDATREMARQSREALERHERMMKEFDERLLIIDDRILNLVSGFGEFLNRLNK